MTNKIDTIKALQLINEALEQPGKRLEAYRAFHRFSLNNQMLAAYQLAGMGLNPTPIKTFNQWKEYGRSVKKGEKAIGLLMPMVINLKGVDEETGEEKVIGQRKIFVEKNYWFALSQTKEYKQDKKKTAKKLEEDAPEWDYKKVLKAFKIKQIDFAIVNGNAQGYTSEKGIAINPLAKFPVKTMIHEIAHNLLGHLDSVKYGDNSLQEAEAEITTYLVISSLGLEGLEYSRHYIQSWLKGAKFPEASAQKCITTAGKILEAGKIEIKSNRRAA